MNTYLIINEADRSIVTMFKGYNFEAIRKAEEIAAVTPGSYLVVEINARVTSKTVIKTESEKYPENICGGVFDSPPVEILPAPIAEAA